MGRGRVFSCEVKLSVVRQVASGEKRPAQACREHGIAEGLLSSLGYLPPVKFEAVRRGWPEGEHRSARVSP